jgi:hypothetical protein
MKVFHKHKPVEIERTIGSFRKGGIQFEYKIPIIRYRCEKCDMVCEVLDAKALQIEEYRYKFWHKEEK